MVVVHGSYINAQPVLVFLVLKVLGRQYLRKPVDSNIFAVSMYYYY